MHFKCKTYIHTPYWEVNNPFLLCKENGFLKQVLLHSKKVFKVFQIFNILLNHVVLIINLVYSAFLTPGIWHCSAKSLRTHLGGFSIISKQLVLSVNVMWENWISSWRYCNRKNRKSSSIVSSVIYIMYVSRYYGGSNTVGYHNLVTIRSINGLILVSLFLIQSLHISHLNKGIYILFRNVI